MTFTEWLEYFAQYGITDNALRSMAYEFASRDERTVPEEVYEWIERCMTERGLLA